MSPNKPLSKAEFIALAGVISAWTAFAIDAMLPAMDRIAAELTPEDPNLAQLVVTSYVLGLGIGTFFTGALSDALGRRPVILGGAVLFIAGAALCYWAPSLELLLVARVIQGLGGSAPRVVMLAIVRDLYEGRQMAKIVSFIMVVFTIVPAIAPSIGAGIISLSSWRGIFVAFVLFSGATILWFALRQAETHPSGRRRPLRWCNFSQALKEIIAHPTVRRSLLAQTLVFGALFTTLSTIQPVFDRSFAAKETFHLWFALISVASGSWALLNAAIVERLGMRRIIVVAALCQAIFAVVMLVATLTLTGGLFVLYVVWVISVFIMIVLTLGNLNALALEPMGHIAGMATSLISSLSTIGAVAIAGLISLIFDGTPLWPAVGVALCAAGIVLLIRGVERPNRPSPAA